MYRGEWESNTFYSGSSIRKDVVKGSDNEYWMVKDGQSHTSATATKPVTGGSYTTYWESFGATFSSVATDILFAQDVYADRTVNIGSSGGTPVIALDADDGNSNNNPFIGINSTAYDADDGIFLGFNSATPKLSLKNSDGSKYFRWTGAALEVDAGAFSIDSSGNIVATNVDLTGEINASTGTIGGFNIGTELTNTAGSTLNLKGATGQLTASAAQITGKITAESGTIGGFNIGTDLTNSAGSTLNLKGSTGQLTASAAQITGKITAETGTIGGFNIGTDLTNSAGSTLNLKGSTGQITASAIQATGGSIGGFTLSNNHLSGSSSALIATNVGNDRIEIRGVDNTISFFEGTKSSDKILEMGKFSSVQYDSPSDVINSYGMKISGSVTSFGNNAGRISVTNPDITDGIDFGAMSIFYQTHYANIYSKIDMGTDQGVMHGRGSIHGEIHSGITSNSHATLGLISGVVGRVTETNSGHWDMSSGVTGISSANAMNTEGGGIDDGTYGVVSIGNAFVKGTLKIKGTATTTTIVGGTITAAGNGIGGAGFQGNLNGNASTATTATNATNSTFTYTSGSEGGQDYYYIPFTSATGVNPNFNGSLRTDVLNLYFYPESGRLNIGGYITALGGIHVGGTSDPGNDNLVVDGYIRSGGNITAYYSSDINLKDNIRPIENALFKVKQLRGIEFDWNDKAGEVEREKGHDVGLIAQEVEKVLPEIVQTREDGIKAIQYEKVTTLLVQAIKEQQELIEKLQEKVERLENK